MHYLKMSKSKEWAPSSSKPYLVHELLPVWGGITEDDRLVHFLSHCHGNNSCNQSAPSGCRSLPGMLLRVNVVAGLTLRRNPPLKRCAWARTEEETREAFFAVSALWIEGNRSSPVLTPPPLLSLLELTLAPFHPPALPLHAPQTCAFVNVTL